MFCHALSRRFFNVNLACVIALFAGCISPQQPPPLPSPEISKTENIVRLAGDADATPMFRYLARVFSSRYPGKAIVIEDPIDGPGALRALDVGILQGVFILGPAPARYQRHQQAVAQTEVVLVVGSSVPERALAESELMATLDGESSRWPNGLVRGFLLRGLEDPLQQAFAESIPGMAELIRKAHLAKRWPVLGAQESMGGELSRHPGTVGIAGLGNLRVRGSPVWTVPLENHEPPLVSLSLVTEREPSNRLQEFLTFMQEAEGQTLISDLGFERRAEP